MRIVHLTSAHPWHDIRIFTKMCRSLASSGHEVHLVALRGDRDGAETVDGVSVHALRPAASRLERVTTNVHAALDIGAELQGDVYHFHDPEFLLVARRWQQKLGAPFVYDAHEDYRVGIRDKAWLPLFLRRPIAWTWGQLEDRAVARLAGVVAATPAIAERFAGHPHLAVIQNLPLVDELAPQNDAESRTPGLFVYVGVISAHRGAREMVQALARAGAGAALALAGEFSPEDLRDQCAELPGWTHVQSCGYLDRGGVRALLSKAVAGFVLFHPLGNHVRAQPNKLFEYMAAGLPVIASNFPLWRRIVEEAQCGLLVDPLDPDAIAVAMKWIIANPDEAKVMGARGRRAVVERLNWNVERGKLISLYEAIRAATSVTTYVQR